MLHESAPTGSAAVMVRYCICAGAIFLLAGGLVAGQKESEQRMDTAASAPSEGQVVRRFIDPAQEPNLVDASAWRAWGEGFERDGEAFVCDNGDSEDARRGLTQVIKLDQDQPRRIFATASSKAQDAGGDIDAGYSLHLTITHQDGTVATESSGFAVATHGWQGATIDFMPDKPVKQVEMRLGFADRSGKAWFREAALREIRLGKGECMFDGLPVRPEQIAEGFSIRDVAAGGDFVSIDERALDIALECKTTREGGAVFYDVTIEDLSGRDRAITLVHALPVAGEGWRWLDGPRTSEPIEPGQQYWHTNEFHAGANGLLSYYPFAAIASAERGLAVGLDITVPAFFRTAFNSGTNELYIAYDIGLAPQRPKARLRFCRYEFDPRWGFRSALARYYELFAESFRCRTPEQGLWMPFAKISEVKDWKDFGFKFKEGTNETAWDDKHGILTFHYSEPLSWWMKMPPEMPRNYEAALAMAKRLAAEGDAAAEAWVNSAIYDEQGRPAGKLMDTPWCDGAFWSINSAPGVPGEVTDFTRTWSPRVRQRLYGSKRRGQLDGEYIDSIEHWHCETLNFRRGHFATAQTPLCFSLETRRPAIFKGLIVFEHVRAMADDVHADDKLMMANGTPGRMSWLAGLLDVMGTETNWNRRGRWSPMSDRDMLFRRSMAATRPYCFLMNTDFKTFTYDMAERYMKRSLAYGMFPGFFSPIASGSSHYFREPELYERDRPLFKKYLPLCKKVAEAGWRPVTLARSSDQKVYVERFGERYLTVFNDSDHPRKATVTLEGLDASGATELLSGSRIAIEEGSFSVSLGAEDVAVIDLRPAADDSN
jgi:hypothetical protein